MPTTSAKRIWSPVSKPCPIAVIVTILSSLFVVPAVSPSSVSAVSLHTTEPESIAVLSAKSVASTFSVNCVDDCTVIVNDPVS